MTIVPSWVSELQVPPSVSGEPQVPPPDPLDEPPDEEPDPEAPLEAPDEPLEPDDAPELPPLEEPAPLEDEDEASSLDPPSPVGAPEPELELHANDAPAASARSATHHPANGNVLDIDMVLSPGPAATAGISVSWYQAPGGLVEEFGRAQWCTRSCGCSGPSPELWPRQRGGGPGRRAGAANISLSPRLGETHNLGFYGAKSLGRPQPRNPRGRQ